LADCFCGGPLGCSSIFRPTAHPEKANRPTDNMIAIDFTAPVYLALWRESTDYE